MRNTTLAFAVLFLLVSGLLLVSLSLGSVSIPFQELISAVFGNDEGASSLILWQLRMPRTVTAALAGAALAVSGLLMQTLFRNPLAGPFVLGISSGASLGVALLMFLQGMSLGEWLKANDFILRLGPLGAALIGSFAVLFLILSVSRRIGSSTTLLIMGLMLGYATSGLVSLLVYFGEARQIQSFFFWSFGSFGKVDPTLMYWFSGIICIGVFASLVLAKQLNVFMLGEVYARSIGLDVQWIRLFLISTSSVLAAVVTAFCGPVAFLGIAVPHLARRIFQTADHRILIPAVVLCGASFSLLADTAARLPGSEMTLPLNAITSVLGAPVVIWVILGFNSRKG
jgi:iron complex transport system permease protein